MTLVLSCLAATLLLLAPAPAADDGGGVVVPTVAPTPETQPGAPAAPVEPVEPGAPFAPADDDEPILPILQPGDDESAPLPTDPATAQPVVVPVPAPTDPPPAQPIATPAAPAPRPADAAQRVAELQQAVRALTAQGRAREALQALEEIIRLAPDQPGPWLDKALIHAGAEQDNDAFAAIQRAAELGFSQYWTLQLAPAFTRLRAHPGMDALMGKIKANAVAEARQALRRQPLDPGSHYAMARHLAELGRYDEALSALRKSATNGLPDPDALAAPSLAPLREDPAYPAIQRRIYQNQLDAYGGKVILGTKLGLGSIRGLHYRLRIPNGASRDRPARLAAILSAGFVNPEQAEQLTPELVERNFATLVLLPGPSGGTGLGSPEQILLVLGDIARRYPEVRADDTILLAGPASVSLALSAPGTLGGMIKGVVLADTFPEQAGRPSPWDALQQLPDAKGLQVLAVHNSQGPKAERWKALPPQLRAAGISASVAGTSAGANGWPFEADGTHPTTKTLLTFIEALAKGETYDAGGDAPDPIAATPSAPQPASGQKGEFTCPLHPDLRLGDPQEICPRCGMPVMPLASVKPVGLPGEGDQPETPEESP